MNDSAASAGDTNSRRQRSVLAVVFIGTFMAPLDASIVNMSLTTLIAYFGAGITAVEWVIMGYLLTTSSLLLLAGRLGDLWGHKRIYAAGFIVFTAASAACGLAPSLMALVLFRVIQALGGTCLLATGPAILTAAFPPQRRGRALGTLGVSVALGLTAGPFLGGLILQHFGWRWIFLVNVPVGIITTILALILLDDTPRAAKRHFDYPGAAAAFGSLFAVLLAFSQGSRWGWFSPSFIGLLLAGIFLAAAFVAIERRAPEALVDLSLFQSRLFASANASALINFMGMFVLLIATPFYLVEIYHLPHRYSGMMLTIVPLLTGLIAPFSGALSDRIGSRFLSSLGLALVSMALFALGTTKGRGDLNFVAACLGCAGIGAGLFQSPNTNAIMGAVPKTRLGVASGMQATMRNLGMVLGVALAGAVIDSLAPLGSGDPGLAHAIRAVYMTGAAVAAVGVLISVARGGGRLLRP